VDTCRAYYAGSNTFVEVDIVLPANMVLRDSHDIGESLQQKLESLPDVERAFVHADYETSHKPEVNIHHLFIVLKKTPKLKFFCNFFYPASKDKISVESEKDLNRSCIIKKKLEL
jgi:hypothetical protein